MNETNDARENKQIVAIKFDIKQCKTSQIYSMELSIDNKCNKNSKLNLCNANWYQRNGTHSQGSKT